MAKYQNMLVVIDPNQDDQPALGARCTAPTDWWTHQSLFADL
jgi:hypothetical protein